MVRYNPSVPLEPEIAAYYEQGREHERLSSGPGRLEFLRTWELISARLPDPPAAILDVGGAAGVYAVPLAERGYEVSLVDPVPLLVEQARAAAEKRGVALAEAGLGDARALAAANASMDAVLLLGPLYHLSERADPDRGAARGGARLAPRRSPRRRGHLALRADL